MKLYENESAVTWLIEQMRRRMSGAERRTGPWHASDLDRCLRRSWLTRKHNPPHDAETILRFAGGFAMQEWFLGQEDAGVVYTAHEPGCSRGEQPEKDGDCQCPITAIFSADKSVGQHILEFKTTRKKMADFNEEDLEHWLSRTRSYCMVHGKKKAHIFVFFWFQTAVRAWTLEFNDADLAASKKEIEASLKTLTGAGDTPPAVTTRKFDWECGLCPFYYRFCQADLTKRGMKLPERVYATQFKGK